MEIINFFVFLMTFFVTFFFNLFLTFFITPPLSAFAFACFHSHFQLLMLMLMSAKADPVTFQQPCPLTLPSVMLANGLHSHLQVESFTLAPFPTRLPWTCVKVPMGRRVYWLLGLSSTGTGHSRPRCSRYLTYPNLFLDIHTLAVCFHLTLP